MKRKKYWRFFVVFTVPLMVVFSQCLYNLKDEVTDVRGSDYAGAVSCMQCHKSIYNNYLHQAHSRTSREATQTNVSGSFNKDSNTVVFDDHLKAVMKKQGDALYQVSYANGKVINKQRFNLVFGVRKGETYLYWKNSQALQLPVTYYLALHRWGNSPGYAGNSINFSRRVGRRCFECHSSYIKEMPQSVQTSSFEQSTLVNKNTLIAGIDCERCHGPAAAHVKFHQQNTSVKTPQHIVQFSALTRAQRMDVCAVCHSGTKSILVKSTFAFKPGDTLSKYKAYEAPTVRADLLKADVHGNQYQLLESSKCFVQSKMECNTCHSIHAGPVNNVQMYAQRCLACHTHIKHSFSKQGSSLQAAVRSKCIDCHMPLKASNVIVVHGRNNQSTPIMIRTHRIAVYANEAEKILAWYKKDLKLN
jgi:hypothetical protein